MSLPTYIEIARRTMTTIPPPAHRATRSGIRKYLMLISDEKVSAHVPWYRLWLRIDWVHAWIRSLHIEIPLALWREDQARLAAKLAQPVYINDDPMLRREKERAIRWTRRR